jgi:hypothetical protein
VLNERLLADVYDEEDATLEKEMLKLTAKQNQMELTLAALKQNLAEHQKKVDQAHAAKNKLGARDLAYRRDNYSLYKSIFDFILRKPEDNYHRFFHVWDDADEVVTYQIDLKIINTAIATHEAHALKLSALLSESRAAAILRETIADVCHFVKELETFKDTLEKNQIRIKKAVALYADTLERLEKLTDELDYNEDIQKQVQKDIEALKVTQARCEALEKSYPSCRP